MNTEKACIENHTSKRDYPAGISKLLERTEQRRKDSICAADPYEPNGHYMSLMFEPYSDEARRLSHDLAYQISSNLRRKYKPNKTMIEATGCILAHLLQSLNDEGGYCLRSVNSNSFNGFTVGKKAFVDTISSLESLGYIKVLKGRKELGKIGIFRASRYGVGKPLEETFQSRGIKAEYWSAHFRMRPRPGAIKNAVVLKECSTKRYGKFGDKIPGKVVKIDKSHPKVIESAKKVNAINDFWRNQRLENANHFAFQRIFNMGNDASFSYNKGGRIYSVQSGTDARVQTYQNIERNLRRDIKINGEETCEIDVKCSHPNVLGALMGTPIPKGHDIYQSDTIDREVVKAFVAQNMGSNKSPRGWSNEVVKSFKKKSKKYGRENLLPKYKFSDVKAAAFANFPLLARWNDLPYRWGDLQFIESEAVLDAVYILATTYNVPALPVHDSLIVPKSMVSIAETVLTECFEQSASFTPTLELK